MINFRTAGAGAECALAASVLGAPDCAEGDTDDDVTFCVADAAGVLKAPSGCLDAAESASTPV